MPVVVSITVPSFLVSVLVVEPSSFFVVSVFTVLLPEEEPPEVLRTAFTGISAETVLLSRVI